VPRLRVLTTCPGEPAWLPGQVVDATPEQAARYLAERRAEVVRDRPMERATEVR
jgi:hypothetical protein